MLKKNKTAYIHMYIDVEDETVYFHSTSTLHPLGKSLLDFVYFKWDEAKDVCEQIRDLHPYFLFWKNEEIYAFFEDSCQSNFKDNVLQKMTKIQNTYAHLLEVFVNKSSECSEEAQHYLLRHPLYSSGTLMNQTVKNENRWMIDYFIMSFEDCLMCELMEMVRRGQKIKVCKNCGRLFLPKRSNVEYCNRYYTEDGRTCTEVGYSKTFEKTVQQDELLQAYTRAYKTHYARMTKPRKTTANMTREAFEEWHQQAKKNLEFAREGKISADAFKEWLKK